MKFLIKTLGCKVNQSESDQLAFDLTQKGLEKTESSAQADIIIINSCTVTSLADAKVRKLVRKAQRSTNGEVIVVGCAVDNSNSDVGKIEGIELVKNKDKSKLADRFEKLALKKNELRKSRNRPLLKIQDGCSHSCSYCIVPAVRGKSTSLSIDSIKSKAKQFLSQGFQEIVLTGVDIGAYRYEGLHLDDLLSELLALDDDFRIRLGSLEPQSISDRFVSFFAGEERLCSHIHMPLQSGSDKILKLMNRPYGRDEFKLLYNMIKQLRDDVAITTDVIVGFPSETEEDFLQTLSLVEELCFARTHVFRYSQRPGTDAMEMASQVDEAKKKERAKNLGETTGNLADDFKKNMVGKIVDVLAEHSDGKYMKGTTSNYCPIYFEGEASNSQLVKVKVSRYEEDHLFGKLT